MPDTTSTTLHPAAVAAAQWWAEQVTGTPVFRATRPGEPGAESMELASMMATILAAGHEPAEGAGELYAALLAERIDAKMTAHLAHWPDGYVSLAVDYGPDGDLAEPAEAAGISLSRFPWKTCMWVRPDLVTVSLGYQAPIRIVWHAEDWQRPTCPDHRWTGGEHGFTDDLCGLPQYHEGDHDYTRTDDRTCKDCGLTYAGHHNRDRQPGDWHGFEAAQVQA